MTKDEVLKLALEALENNKQTHYYCEDTWHSCPQHEDGCANDSAGDECNCGADKANAEIGKALTAIDEVLAQPEQEYHAVNAVHKGQQCYVKTQPKEPEHGWTPERIAGMARLKEAQDKKLAQPEQHQDWCASLTQMLMSMPPKPAPCNCKPPQRTWVGLMRGVRVEGDNVIISVHYGNDAARQVCGALIEEMST